MFASAMTSSAGFAAQWTASITTKATMIIKSKQTHKCMQEVDEGKTITVYKWWRFSWTSSESCVVIGCRPKKVQICNCYVVHPTCNPTLTVPRPGACKTPKPPCGVCTKGCSIEHLYHLSPLSVQIESLENIVPLRNFHSNGILPKINSCFLNGFSDYESSSVMKVLHLQDKILISSLFFFKAFL